MNISTLTRCATGRCCLFGRAWTQIMAPVHLLFLKQAPRSEKKVPFRSWKKEIWQVPLMWRLVRILLQYKYFNTVLCVAQPAACYCFFGWAWKQIMALSLLFLRQASSLDAAFGFHLFWLRAVRWILSVLPFNSIFFSSSCSAGLAHNQHFPFPVPFHSSILKLFSYLPTIE